MELTQGEKDQGRLCGNRFATLSQSPFFHSFSWLVFLSSLVASPS